MPSIVLLGRKGFVVGEARSQVPFPDPIIYTDTNIDNLRSVFSGASVEARTIDHVFMGTGTELEKRLEIVKEVFAYNQTTYVNMKDAASGKEGFLTFVGAVLKVLYA